jgi:hypothetical protein
MQSKSYTVAHLQAKMHSTCRAVLLSLGRRWLRWQSTSCPPSREMQSVRRIAMPMWYWHPACLVHRHLCRFVASHDCPPAHGCACVVLHYEAVLRSTAAAPHETSNQPSRPRELPKRGK